MSIEETIIAGAIVAIIGAAATVLMSHYLRKKSDAHAADLNNIYRPLHEEFERILSHNKYRLEHADMRPWTPSDIFLKMKMMGDLHPRRLGNLWADIGVLESLNWELENWHREYWEDIEAKLSVATATEEKNDLFIRFRDLLSDAPLMSTLKQRLFVPLYLNQENDVTNWLDLQAPDWRYASQIPAIKEVAQEVFKRVEEGILHKRHSYLLKRQALITQSNTLLRGLESPIRSGGSKPYRHTSSGVEIETLESQADKDWQSP